MGNLDRFSSRGMRNRRFGALVLLALLAAVACLAVDVRDTPAQTSPFAQGGLSQQLGGGGASRDLAIRTQFTAATDERPAVLFVEATVASGFHVYAVDQGSLPDGGGGPQTTTIEITSPDSVKLLAPFRPTQAPETHIDKEIWTGLEIREHADRVVWYAPIKLTDGVDPATLVLKGTVSAQICNPQTCIPIDQTFEAREGQGVALSAEAVAELKVAADQPQADISGATEVETSASVVIPDSGDLSEAPLPEAPMPESTGLSTTKGVTYDLEKIILETNDHSFIYYFVTAFVAGLILNVMPCVLPVIGLKVMSFVQQAGESRSRALMLNVWYAAGIVVVFLILAGLAISLQMGWGSQFSSAKFNIILISIVFAMALSLLGLWEIRSPVSSVPGLPWK